MYPYIDFGPVHLGTFGLLLWLAAVAATVVLHRNFVRNGVDADALNVVAFVVIAGMSCRTSRIFGRRFGRLARRDGSIRWMWLCIFCTGFRLGLLGSAECWPASGC
jgi:hypothetical protein